MNRMVHAGVLSHETQCAIKHSPVWKEMKRHLSEALLWTMVLHEARYSEKSVNERSGRCACMERSNESNNRNIQAIDDLMLLRRKLLEFDEHEVMVAIDECLFSGHRAEEIVRAGLCKGMLEAVQLFKERKFFIPEVLVLAGIMKNCLGYLGPRLRRNEFRSKGRIVIGTVEGDLHDTGKSLVGLFLEISGYEVIDLGADVSPEALIEIARDSEIGAIAISASQSTTMEVMREIVIRLDEAGMRDQTKVIIGGAPVNQSFAEEIKADGYAQDPMSAVELCSRLLIA